MKRNDYFKLADLLNEFRKEFKQPEAPFTRQAYEEYIKYNTIVSSIDTIAELAEYMGNESK